MKLKNELITSKSNSTVVRIRALNEKKHRDREQLFRLDGIKLTEEALKNGIVPKLVLIRRSSYEKLEYLLEKAPDTEGLLLSDDVFDKLNEEKSPEGIICIAKHLDNFKKIATINNNIIKNEDIHIGGALLLESIRDPGNLGTVIRSAVALGIKRIVMSEDCVDIYNPKTLRASMGAIFGAKLYSVPSIPQMILALRENDNRVYAAALDRNAKRLDDMTISKSDCFVVGNEGHGLSRETIEACNGSVFIPIEANSESLNAAAAAAIILWEMKRAKR